MASPAEVERVFDVALAELADPGIFHEERWQIPGRAHPRQSDDDSFAVWFFEVSGEMIWGATARMLYEFMHRRHRADRDLTSEVRTRSGRTAGRETRRRR